MAHGAEAAVGEQGVVVPAHRAAVAATESLAVPQQPVEPQAELQVLDALRPVLSSVLLQRVAVGRVQRHDVLLGETFEAVLLILSLHQQGRDEEGQSQAQAVQQHRHLHRLRLETVVVLNGSGRKLRSFLYQGKLMSVCT